MLLCDRSVGLHSPSPEQSSVGLSKTVRAQRGGGGDDDALRNHIRVSFVREHRVVRTPVQDELFRAILRSAAETAHLRCRASPPKETTDSRTETAAWGSAFQPDSPRRQLWRRTWLRGWVAGRAGGVHPEGLGPPGAVWGSAWEAKQLPPARPSQAADCKLQELEDCSHRVRLYLLGKMSVFLGGKMYLNEVLDC